MKMRDYHPITIRSGTDHSTPECDQIRTWLRDFNRSENREFMELISRPGNGIESLALIAEVSAEGERPGRLVGGLIADIRLSWLRISIMAVDPEWKSRGVGRKLLAEAEYMAIRRGCLYSYVDTMSYQAPEFYEANGYRRIGEIPDWDSHGHAKLFLVKDLTEG